MNCVQCRQSNVNWKKRQLLKRLKTLHEYFSLFRINYKLHPSNLLHFPFRLKSLDHIDCADLFVWVYILFSFQRIGEFDYEATNCFDMIFYGVGLSIKLIFIVKIVSQVEIIVLFLLSGRRYHWPYAIRYHCWWRNSKQQPLSFSMKRCWILLQASIISRFKLQPVHSLANAS